MLVSYPPRKRRVHAILRPLAVSFDPSARLATGCTQDIVWACLIPSAAERPEWGNTL